MLTEHRREAIFDELCSWCAAYAVGQASNAEIDEWGITYALGVAALRALNQVERDLGVGSEFGSPREGSHLAATEGKPLPSRRPITIGAILDGPSDYITKALNTFDAPDVPIPADVTTKVKGDQHCATVATAAVIAKVTRMPPMSGITTRATVPRLIVRPSPSMDRLHCIALPGI